MKVTTKGQVTIPQVIRDQLGIHPGAEVDFQRDGNTVRLIPIQPAKERGLRIVNLLRGRSTIGMTTDEIMKLTRGD